MELLSIDTEAEQYVIKCGDGTSRYGFDNALAALERVLAESVGRGMTTGTRADFLIREAHEHRGSATVLVALNVETECLRVACKDAGDRAAYDLSPQLVGLEGHRVEVITTYGECRRFIVGKSTGWAPCHLEIKKTNSSGGMPAEREYAEVRELGRVR